MTQAAEARRHTPSSVGPDRTGRTSKAAGAYSSSGWDTVNPNSSDKQNMCRQNLSHASLLRFVLVHREGGRRVSRTHVFRVSDVPARVELFVWTQSLVDEQLEVTQCCPLVEEG